MRTEATRCAWGERARTDRAPPLPLSLSRCSVARALLESVEDAPAGSERRARTLAAVGECMRQTHRGYTSIGLGCAELDAMIAALAPIAGVHGARVSGGGSGGTVAVLCDEDALPAVRALAERLTFGKPFSALIC